MWWLWRYSDALPNVIKGLGKSKKARVQTPPPPYNSTRIYQLYFFCSDDKLHYLLVPKRWWMVSNQCTL